MDSQGSLQISIKEGSLENCKECILNGVDVNGRIGWIYPLHVCCMYIRPEICQLLLEYKANPSPKENGGVQSPLSILCNNFPGEESIKDRMYIAKMLLYAGSLIDSLSKSHFIIKKLLQSKTSCRLALGAVYLVLKKHTRQSKDMTNLIMNTVWDIRFEFIKDL